MIPRAAHFPDPGTELRDALATIDLELFGVAAVDADTDAAKHAVHEYRQWIASGLHGEMDYLARHEPMKYAPQQILPGCRSVIVVGCNYYQAPAAPSDSGERGARETGRVARYAWGRDYHNALGKRLKRAVATLRRMHPTDEFRPFVDASPLSERFFAERAGVGFTARNTLTISGAYGSWFFLGEILTTRDYDPTPVSAPVHGGCPSSCFRCGTVCPTGALYDHYRIDARRCISYLTIEHRGSIPVDLRPLIGDWIFGCDLCQEVCPLNVRARATTLADFRAHRAGERLRLDDLLSTPDDDAYRKRFAGTPLLRPGRDAMVRNACIAAGNSGGTDLLPALKRLTADRSILVREHAIWAVESIEPTTATR
ncbi:MAG: tRNA epoxyqueuosine(34) reductase QueG [Spirochaetaceae bacterium]|nr:MAG: tRNA epoxyqueuosine(34) reductase QueG [Spirochaetaceae bacterium]